MKFSNFEIVSEISETEGSINFPTKVLANVDCEVGFLFWKKTKRKKVFGAGNRFYMRWYFSDDDEPIWYDQQKSLEKLYEKALVKNLFHKNNSPNTTLGETL